MLPPAWFLRPEAPTTSLHCSGTSIGCVSLSVSSYVCKLCVLATGVCMARHRRTSPMTFTRLLLLMATAVTSGPLTLQFWCLGLPDARRLATVHFPWQLHVLGTIVHQPPGMRHHFCLSRAACRHAFMNWRWRNTDFIWLHFVSFCCFYQLCKVPHNVIHDSIAIIILC